MRTKKTTKKSAALSQIHQSIRMLEDGKFEAAITLALAAEGSLPLTDKPHVLGQLREAVPDKEEHRMFNMVRDWLKHHNEGQPEEVELTEFDAAIAIVRGASRFIAVYGQSTKKIEGFLTYWQTLMQAKPGE